MQITEPSPSFEDCIEDGKNKYTVTCQFCPSRMLSPSTASHVTNEVTIIKAVLIYKKES